MSRTSTNRSKVYLSLNCVLNFPLILFSILRDDSDLNTSLSDGDSGLQKQINDLNTKQGQMSQDLKDIGSSSVISILNRLYYNH